MRRLLAVQEEGAARRAGVQKSNGKSVGLKRTPQLREKAAEGLQKLKMA
jgi:hypothetical protein